MERAGIWGNVDPGYLYNEPGGEGASNRPYRILRPDLGPDGVWPSSYYEQQAREALNMEPARVDDRSRTVPMRGLPPVPVGHGLDSLQGRKRRLIKRGTAL